MDDTLPPRRSPRLLSSPPSVSTAPSTTSTTSTTSATSTTSTTASTTASTELAATMATVVESRAAKRRKSSSSSSSLSQTSRLSSSHPPLPLPLPLPLPIPTPTPVQVPVPAPAPLPLAAIAADVAAAAREKKLAPTPTSVRKPSFSLAPPPINLERSMSLSSSSLLSSSLSSSSSSSSASLPASVHVVLISVNDVYQLTNFPYVRTKFLNAMVEPGVDAVFLTLNGDFLAPSELSTFDNGLGMVKVLNATGFTHVCFGNHEFDLPKHVLDKRISEFSGVWLNSNVLGFDNSTKMYDIQEVKGFKIGFFGVCTEETVHINGLSTAPDAAIKFRGHRDAAKEVVAKLRQEHHVDFVIGLTHVFISEDQGLARLTPGLSLILGGHEHFSYLGLVNGVPIVKTGEDANSVARIDVVITGVPGQSPEVATSVSLTSANAEAADVSVKYLADELMKSVGDCEHWVVYKIPKGVTLSSKNIRSAQTSVGTLLAQASIEFFSADVAIINSGTIRAGLDYESVLTVKQVRTECPFSNVFFALPMPGRVLQDAIKYSLHKAGQSYGGYFQVAGCSLFPDCTIMSVQNCKWRRIVSDLKFNEVDANQDGFISVAELREFLGKKYGYCFNDGDLEEIISSMDLNKDGLVSKYEFSQYLANKESPFDPDRMYRVVLAKRMLEGMDHNQALMNYGKLNPQFRSYEGHKFSELVIGALFRRKYRDFLQQAKFEELDTNKDGLIDQRELYDAIVKFMGEACDPKEVEFVLSSLDTNEDGMLTRRELLRSLLS